MNWNREEIEAFFGASFKWIDPLWELRVQAGGLKYRLWIDEPGGVAFLTADPKDPDHALPAIEVGIACGLISTGLAIPVGPILNFYVGTEKSDVHLRLCITRTPDGIFSVSPSWPLSDMVKTVSR